MNRTNQDSYNDLSKEELVEQVHDFGISDKGTKKTLRDRLRHFNINQMDLKYMKLFYHLRPYSIVDLGPSENQWTRDELTSIAREKGIATKNKNILDICQRLIDFEETHENSEEDDNDDSDDDDDDGDGDGSNDIDAVDDDNDDDVDNDHDDNVDNIEKGGKKCLYYSELAIDLTMKMKLLNNTYGTRFIPDLDDRDPPYMTPEEDADYTLKCYTVLGEQLMIYLSRYRNIVYKMELYKFDHKKVLKKHPSEFTVEEFEGMWRDFGVANVLPSSVYERQEITIESDFENKIVTLTTDDIPCPKWYDPHITSYSSNEIEKKKQLKFMKRFLKKLDGSVDQYAKLVPYTKIVCSFARLFWIWIDIAEEENNEQIHKKEDAIIVFTLMG